MVIRFRSNGRTGRNNGEWQQGFGFLTAISKTCLLPPEQETVTPCQKSVTPLKKLLPPAIVAKTCRRATRSPCNSLDYKDFFIDFQLHDPRFSYVHWGKCF